MKNRVLYSLILSVYGILFSGLALAQTTRYQNNIRGGFTAAANSLTNSSGTNVNTAGGTTASSTSDLILPAGSTIIKAFLYVECYGVPPLLGTVSRFTSARFRAEGNAPVTLTTTSPGFLGNPINADYIQIMWDVTSLVSPTGYISSYVNGGAPGTAGEYAVIDPTPYPGSNNGIGWSLVVIYTNPASKYRSVTVADGCQYVADNTTRATVNITNIIVPTIGPINAAVMCTGSYGDATLGDLVSFGITGGAATNLNDPQTGVSGDNLNSTIAFSSLNNVSRDGGPAMNGNYQARNPSTVPYLYDCDIMDASGILPNSPTPISVTIKQGSTGGDVLGFGVYAISIDIAAARLSKSLNPTSIITGGTATYTFKIGNSHAGAINLSGINFTDSLPAGLQIQNPNGVTITGGTGTVTAVPGTDVFKVSNFTIAGGTDGYITLNVTNKPGQLNPECGTNPKNFTNGFNNISGTTTNITNDVTNQCLVILPMPKPGFIADTVCLGDPTSFTDTTTIAPGVTVTSYDWTFGDGQTSTTQNPSHVYTTAGIYNVKFKLTLAGGATDSITKAILVKNKPVVTVSSAQTICIGDTVRLTATGGGTYAWSPNTSIDSVNVARPRVYPTATITYRVVVTDPSGCQEDSTVQVTVNNKVYAGTDGVDSICQGSNNVSLFNLIGNEESGGKWIGTSVGLSSGILNATAIPAGDQVYKYVMTASAPCKNDTAIVNIHIKALPTAAFQSIPAFCKGTTEYLPFNLTGTPPFTITYENNGLSTTLTDVKPADSLEITPSGNTSYQITEITDSPFPSCTNKTVKSVSVNLLTPPLLTVDSLVCNNTNTGYNAYMTLSGGDATSYTLNGTAVSGAKQVSNLITSGSQYNFTLSDANNCQPVSKSVGTKVCNCQTDAGTMATPTIYVCGADTAKATPNGDHDLDGNDVLVYILHDGAGKALGNIIAINKTKPHFVYDVAWGIQYNNDYYISTVVGDPESGDPTMVDLSNPTGCLSVAKGEPVQFRQLPMLTASINPQICLGDTAYMSFAFTTGKPGFNISLSGGAIIPARSAVKNNHPVIPGAIGTFNYTIIQIEDTNNCKSAVNIPLSVLVVDQPDTANVVRTCNSTNTAYQVSFNILNGDPQSYKVNNVRTNAPSFTSQWINSGSSYDFHVTDTNFCDEARVFGSFTCPCVSNAGTMTIASNATPLEFCINSVATATHNGNQVLDGNDTLSYILCINPNNAIATLVQHKSTPSFSFIPGMIANQTYYICPIAGDKNGAGIVDVTSFCKNTSAGTPVKFIPLPDAKITGNTEICTGSSATIRVSVTGNKNIQFVLRGSDGSTQNVSGTGTFNVTVNPQITKGTVRYTIDTAGTPGVFDSTSPTSCEGAWTSAPVDIVVHPTPTAVISGNEIICLGDTAPIRIVTTGDGPLTVQYGYGGPPISFTDVAKTNNLKVSPIPDGTYTYTILSIRDNTPASCIGTGSGTATIVVRPIPQASMTTSDNDVCRGQGSSLVFQNQGYGPFSIYFHDNRNNKYNKLQVGDTGSYVLPASLLDSSKTFTLDSILDATQTTTVSRQCVRAYASPVSIIVRQLPYGIMSGSKEICKGESTTIYFDFANSPADSLTANYRVTNKVTGAITNLTLRTFDSRRDSLLVTPADTTTYALTRVRDQYGCYALNPSGIAFIPVNPIPVPQIAATDTNSCPPLQTTLLNQTQSRFVGTYTWHFGDGTTFTGTGADPGNPKTYEKPGAYTVRLEVTSPQGCYKDSTITNFLTVHPFPKAEFNWTPDQVTLMESTAQFHNLSVDNDFNFWTIYQYGNEIASFDVENPQYRFPDQDTGYYPVKLLVRTEFGCEDSMMHTVKVDGVFESYIPNTFTPNGDGINDIFLPQFFGGSAVSYEMLIFDRWGEMLFSANDMTHGWDGRFKGDVCKEDVYVYKVSIRSKYGAEKKEFIGQVRLLK